MTFLPIDTGTPAVPQNIVDAIELNDRFEGLVDTLSLMGYYAKGWIPVSIDGGFEYNTENSIRTGSDIDLTSTIKEGDKITWEHGTTGGDRFGWVSFIDYNVTVANRTYIEIIGNTVLDEAIVSTSIGVSRIANPDGWPQDPNFGAVTFTAGGSISTTSASIVQLGSVQISVPRGRWRVSLSSVGGVRNAGGAQNNLVGRLGLSTSTSSITFSSTTRWWRTRVNTATSELRNLMPYTIPEFSFQPTSTTILYLVGSADSGTETFGSIGSSIGSELVLTARPAYK
jgi:hypothetical protein